LLHVVSLTGVVIARPLRLEFAGALYHVTSRGNVCERYHLLVNNV